MKKDYFTPATATADFTFCTQKCEKRECARNMRGQNYLTIVAHTGGGRKYFTFAALNCESREE